MGVIRVGEDVCASANIASANILDGRNPRLSGSHTVPSVYRVVNRVAVAQIAKETASPPYKPERSRWRVWKQFAGLGFPAGAGATGRVPQFRAVRASGQAVGNGVLP